MVDFRGEVCYLKTHLEKQIILNLWAFQTKSCFLEDMFFFFATFHVSSYQIIFSVWGRIPYPLFGARRKAINIRDGAIRDVPAQAQLIRE